MEPSSSENTDEVQDVNSDGAKMVEYVCFGNMEVGHPECEKCQFKDACGKKLK